MVDEPKSGGSYTKLYDIEPNPDDHWGSQVSPLSENLRDRIRHCFEVQRDRELRREQHGIALGPDAKVVDMAGLSDVSVLRDGKRSEAGDSKGM